MSERTTTSDVRVWALRLNPGKKRTTYSLRWTTGGKRHHRTFGSRKHADQFRSELLVAARDGHAFDVVTGLPTSLTKPADQALTWYDLALEFITDKWPFASARYRKSLAEALTDLSLAFVTTGEAADEPAVRRLLYSWAFNAAARHEDEDPPEELRTALRWVRRRSLPLSALEEPPILRRALTAIAMRRDGIQAAPATFTRKRAALNAVPEYAVEQGHFSANPLRRVKWRANRSSGQVDRRVVVNPNQARRLLAAVEQIDPTMTGFFASLYYAGLRPAEARAVRMRDLTLPDEGWGEAVLTTLQQTAGREWTDSGTRTEQRQLKHRTGTTTASYRSTPTS